jgi:hypothetical protein
MTTGFKIPTFVMPAEASLPTDPAARIAALEAELAAAKAAKPRTITIKMAGEKGCVGLYGVRRFPLSFYPDEWRMIMAQGPQVEAFLEEHGL